MNESENYKWLHISFFCNKKKWCGLLRSFTYPWYNESKSEGLIELMLIHFNEERGDNIRISCRVKRFQANFFLQRLSAKIEAFFALSASDPIDNTPVPIRNFIKDFPMNSVFYGLHTASGSEYPEPVKQNIQVLQSNFSEILLTIFLENDLEDEVLDLCFIYSGIGFLRFFEGIRVTDRLQELVTRRSLVPDQSSIKTIFESGREDFISIVQAVCNPSCRDPELHWLEKWSSACHEFAREMENRPGDNEFPELIFAVLVKLGTQLNLDKEKINRLILLQCIILSETAVETIVAD